MSDLRTPFGYLGLGLIFGLGLIIAGMSDPAKVLNFLDVAAIGNGQWDPSLLYVMGAGVAVTFVGYRFVLARKSPLFAGQFHLPTKSTIDGRIIIGPAIFGVGWGLAGLCPGPAFTALGLGTLASFIFMASLVAGMAAARWLSDHWPH
jgi:uncharacterized membrane protein YedE/YeeE